MMRLTLALSATLLVSCGPRTLIDAPDFIMNSTCAGSFHRNLQDVPVHAYIPADADIGWDAVFEDAEAWWGAHVPGLIKFEGRIKADHPVHADNDHVIVEFVDDPNDPMGIIGITTLNSNDSCVISGTTLRINYLHPTSTTGADIEVISHELGHTLGLAHDRDTESVMYPDVHSAPFILKDETRAELDWIYNITMQM